MKKQKNNSIKTSKQEKHVNNECINITYDKANKVNKRKAQHQVISKKVHHGDVVQEDELTSLPPNDKASTQYSNQVSQTEKHQVIAEIKNTMHDKEKERTTSSLLFLWNDRVEQKITANELKEGVILKLLQ